MLKFGKFSNNLRFYSIKRAVKGSVKYTATINLPKSKFPARLSATKRGEVERNIVETTFAKAYQYQSEHNQEPTFVLHDGPPYANGDLHMGHAVNKILKDITVRQNMIKGRKVHYVPGWDCHGLPIELKALGITGTKDPIAVRQKSKQFALDAIERQKNEFRSWGVLSDWESANGTYFTNNSEFICNQLELFFQLYEKGLIYRDLKPVYWSPSSRTALAEAELEYNNNFVSPSVYVRFIMNTVPPTVKKGQNVYAMIWTTTPWTLPSNQAICFNSNLEYSLVELISHEKDLYLIASNLVEEFTNTTKIVCKIKQTISGRDLLNCTYKHPLDRNLTSLPFFDASHVQDSKGTGLVHTAPAHGPDDFLICLSQNMTVKSLVNEEGCYNSNAPQYLQGKGVLKEGNDAVVQYLKDDVVFESTLTHSYPLDWRTKEPIIMRASEQWFINTLHLKHKASEEIEKIDIYPRFNAEASKNALRTQVMKRPYWCISRQRAWGVPIPVFYEKNTGKVICNQAIVNHISDMVSKEGNIDFWWSKSVAELLPESLLIDLNLKIENVIKGLDIFDIWFDSGSTWSHVLEGQKIADMYLEGYDQFTGWFQSSLLTSIAARNHAPYKSLFVHGFTVDDRGHKMSKSLGNVISPTDITKKYGVDTLRWWVASHGTQHMTITVSDHLLQQAADNLSKVRSTLRYLNGVIGLRADKNEATSEVGSVHLNRHMLSKLISFENDITLLCDSYDYNRVVNTLQNFITNQISANYLHLIKDRLYCGSPGDMENIRFTLTKCYEILNKALWPIAPFLVEESWSYYDPATYFYHNPVKSDANWKNLKIEDIVDAAFEVKRLVNQKVDGAKNPWFLAVNVKCANDDIFNLLQHLHPETQVAAYDTELCEIVQVQCIHLSKSNTIKNSLDVKANEIKGILCPRCRRYLTSGEGEVCQRCCKVLNEQK